MDTAEGSGSGPNPDTEPVGAQKSALADGGGRRAKLAANHSDSRVGREEAQPGAGTGAAPRGWRSGRGLASNSSALLLKRRRLKRHLSAAAAAAGSSAAAAAGKMNSAHSSSSSSMHTRSLDRKTLLRNRQNAQLQHSDRQWVRVDLQRGSIHVHDSLASSHPRPVLCTLDTTAGEIADRLRQLSSKSSLVVKLVPRKLLMTDVNGNCKGEYKLSHGLCKHGVGGECAECGPPQPADRLRLLLLENLDSRSDENPLNSSLTDAAPDDDSEGRFGGSRRCGRNSVSDVESSAFDELSSGARLSEHRDSLSDDMILGTDASALNPADGLDVYGSSSDDLELDCPSAGAAKPELREERPCSSSSSLAEPGDAPPSLYVQLHGEPARRLGRDERPLQIQNDFLFRLGFKDAWRVQEEGMNTELGSLLRFYAGKPITMEITERVQLSGLYNVRKGKLQLPVNRWSRRQVILCGTCLMVSSVKASHTGKMHILPLIGGKVEEVKKHSHCLAFSSSGPQSQTYYINFDSFTEHLRWYRHAAKMVSQRISSVDLSCCGLETLPPNLLYSQDLTHLNLKHNLLPADQKLLQLQRFTRLRSLNLSNNQLGSFPLPVCSILTLTELNLSCNRLASVHSAVGNMHNLQTFLLDGNLLTTLPNELGSLHRLAYLGLSFNEFRQIPLVLEQLNGVERLCMAGNILQQLPLQAFRLLRIKHVDLRLNQISKLVPDEPEFLRHVTQLDVRDNMLTVLDASLFPRLEVLHCERNRITCLRVCGCMLKAVHASSNELRDLTFNWLNCNTVSLIVSTFYRNRMENIPDGLRKLLAGHNRLQRLPEHVERPVLEVLDVQHNQLQALPCNLFLKSHSLRCLNASANQLENIPPSSLSEESHSILQELYLTNNHLTDKCVPLLTGHSHLRVLHMAYNHLQTFAASKMAKLEDLEEVDLSGNRLKTIPTTIMNCKRMHTLIAHSNAIEVFPEHIDIFFCVNIRCFRIDPPSTSLLAHESVMGPAQWSHGYTEASGVKNKLCVAALSVSSFCGTREALFGVFDGDRNVEVPYLLQCTMNDILADELHKSKSEENYMTNTFLVMQRKLGTAGQKLGGSAALCHIRHDPLDSGGCFTLTAANVGKCQAILCRDGKPLPMSVIHNITVQEEYSRIRQHKAIITEDNKVNGVTDSTRIMGYSFLYPSVLPRPHVHTLPLTPQDEFFILGSRGLWESMSPTEAVEAVRNVPDALAAAKKLCTLAQGYGSTESLSTVVVRLSIGEGCCCCCCALAPSQPPPSPGLYPAPSIGLTHPCSASELSSEVSTSEMSSEVGSTASSDEPQLLPEVHLAPLLHPALHMPTGNRCALHPAFQRQMSCTPYCSGAAMALSDNTLDSEDEEPIAGVFSNGSRVEVEADIHNCQSNRTRVPELGGQAEGENASERDSGQTKSFGCRRGNGSVAPQEKSHNLIEVATEAPCRKMGGYFTAPAQPDPDDQLIIPPELEDEVKEIIKQQEQHRSPNQQPTDYYDTPL
uniref:protein-serine/threonine phosphatase n=1 Tax=Denticeps clupeoides TaxID=299321 RepID=A0AAY4AW62_9TELE